MSISRFDPWREALSLRRAMDQLFEQSFVSPRLFGEAAAAAAPMDVIENEQGYQVRVALPGVKPEDIELTVHQNTLTVRGEYSSTQTTEQPPAQGQEAQQQGTTQPTTSQPDGKRQENWIMREIHSGSFSRSISFDRPIDSDRVETSYEHGVLTINLPVTAASRPRRISISGGQSQAGQIEPGTTQQPS